MVIMSSGKRFGKFQGTSSLQQILSIRNHVSTFTNVSLQES